MEEIIESRYGRFAIRPYEQGDEEKVLALWRLAFGRELSSSLWRWKYLENPYERQILLCEESATTQIVAMYAGIPYRANLQGEIVHITHLTDSMSHPAYRGTIGGRKGLFVRTVLAFFARYGGPHASLYLYGFPGERHFRLGRQLLGYRALPGGVCYLTARTADLERSLIPFGGHVERMTVADVSLDQLADASRRLYPFAVVRDAAFLSWRFFAHPQNHYEIVGYRSSLQPRWHGYVVLSVQGDRARLVDCLLPLSEDGTQDFLARLAAWLGEQRIQQVEVWLPAGHFLIAVLTAAGFLPAREPLGIIPTARTFSSRLPWDWAASSLFYTMADGDLL